MGIRCTLLVIWRPSIVVAAGYGMLNRWKGVSGRIEENVELKENVIELGKEIRHRGRWKVRQVAFDLFPVLRQLKKEWCPNDTSTLAFKPLSFHLASNETLQILRTPLGRQRTAFRTAFHEQENAPGSPQHLDPVLPSLSSLVSFGVLRVG